MKYLYHLTLLCILLGSLCLPLRSQVLIMPTYQHTEVFFVDHLFQLSLTNTTANPLTGFIEISIEDHTHNIIAAINSPNITLEAGKMLNSSQINWNAQIAFGQSQFASILQQTGALSRGEFIFCYRFFDNTDQRLLGVNCQEKSILNFGPPELLSPQHQTLIYQPNPILTWKPPTPIGNAGINYHLILTELKEGQSLVEAISTNFSFLSVKNINRRFLLYPLDAPKLTEGKTYVWQVAAYYQGVEIGITDIWEFTYEKKSQKEDKPAIEESYRFVKPALDGSYYLANKILHFAYDNRKSQPVLNYKIYPAENKKKPLRNLPKIPLRTGINKIDIDGDDIKGLKDQQRYLLVVTNQSDQQYYLAFIYQKPK